MDASRRHFYAPDGTPSNGRCAERGAWSCALIGTSAACSALWEIVISPRFYLER